MLNFIWPQKRKQESTGPVRFGRVLHWTATILCVAILILSVGIGVSGLGKSAAEQTVQPTAAQSPTGPGIGNFDAWARLHGAAVTDPSADAEDQKIYEAIRRATQAGNTDDVRKLTEYLESRHSQQQQVGFGQGSRKAFDEAMFGRPTPGADQMWSGAILGALAVVLYLAGRGLRYILSGE